MSETTCKCYICSKEVNVEITQKVKHSKLGSVVVCKFHPVPPESVVQE